MLADLKPLHRIYQRPKQYRFPLCEITLYSTFQVSICYFAIEVGGDKAKPLPEAFKFTFLLPHS